jgi:hypothetical protein
VLSGSALNVDDLPEREVVVRHHRVRRAGARLQPPCVVVGEDEVVQRRHVSCCEPGRELAVETVEA